MMSRSVESDSTIADTIAIRESRRIRPEISVIGQDDDQVQYVIAYQDLELMDKILGHMASILASMTTLLLPLISWFLGRKRNQASGDTKK